MYEATQIKVNSISSVIGLIDSWYKKAARNLVNSLRFDTEKSVSITKFRVLQAYERVLCNPLTCDYEITEKFLEKVKMSSR